MKTDPANPPENVCQVAESDEGHVLDEQSRRWVEFRVGTI